MTIRINRCKHKKTIETIEISDSEIDDAYMTLDHRYVCYPMIANQRLTISDIGIYRCYQLFNRFIGTQLNNLNFCVIFKKKHKRTFKNKKIIWIWKDFALRSH